MSLRLTTAIATAWLVSLVGVGLWAQDRRALVYPMDAHQSQVLTGADIGVRIADQRGPRGEVLGALVVRINGQWVEVTSAPRLGHATMAYPGLQPTPEPGTPPVFVPARPATAVAPSRTFDVEIDGRTVALTGAAVEPTFFDTAKVRPLLGRFFLDADRGPESTPVVVISHGLWQSVLGASPEIIGRRLTVDGRARVIVGIAQPGFDEPAGARLWIPR